MKILGNNFQMISWFSSSKYFNTEKKIPWRVDKVAIWICHIICRHSSCPTLDLELGQKGLIKFLPGHICTSLKYPCASWFESWWRAKIHIWNTAVRMCKILYVRGIARVLSNDVLVVPHLHTTRNHLDLLFLIFKDCWEAPNGGPKVFLASWWKSFDTFWFPTPWSLLSLSLVASTGASFSSTFCMSNIFSLLSKTSATEQLTSNSLARARAWL